MLARYIPDTDTLLFFSMLIMLFYLLIIVYVVYWFYYKFADHGGDHACYIIDFECYKPTDDRKLHADLASNMIMRIKNLDLKDLQFLWRVMLNSGIGGETYVPKSFVMGKEQSPTLSDGILEMEDFFYHTLDKLFSKSSISPSDIDVLVVNVSTFSPMPSLTTRMVNRYKMKEDIKTFNLSGMGCSASLISINLVQNIFKSYKNQLALILTTESIVPNWYTGNDKSMMLTNLLFRSGGCAILLTNRPNLKHKAMFRVKHLVRTHHGAHDDDYQCIAHKEDEDGYLGVSLSKTLPKVAGRAITANLKELAPKILPLRELLRYLLVTCLQKKATMNFKTGIKHFVIHTGGKAVIEGIGKSLGLNDYDLEPSRSTLHRFGNTSAGSIWYVLAYMEAKKRLKQGDAILMISLGAGFKCNSCILEMVRDLSDENVWKDCITSYPAEAADSLFREKFGWLNHADPSTFRKTVQVM
ncbi:3-ketoacyl-CoA synthase [Thalictrum thalictroides]|uniref:3-ketoacyl-CoA synthase n=1 Tax=Thalictrum thalictroides TaxID=46969 RepID=A0A7J6VKC7_THATH|nr:3-ketoacyl-CoA synthase [Thalictrum thalictroides]